MNRVSQLHRFCAGLGLAGSIACSGSPNSPESPTETGENNTEDSAAPWEPWCTSPAKYAAYVDVGEDWAVLDTTDGIPSRYEHNPVAMADLDGDGDDDMLIALREGGVYLQLNEGGFFSQELLIEAWMVTTIALGDVDGDRDLDAVLAGWSPGPVLLLNDGSGSFTDATEGSGLDEIITEGAVRHASFGDLNGDQALDLFITVATPENNPVEDTLDRLLLGDGEGRLVDASDQIEAELRAGLGWATVFVDFDLDGDADLYTLTAEQSVHGPSRLLRNDGLSGSGELQFTDLSESCSCAWTGSTMGVSAADLNQDGLPDFYLTNTGPSQLLLNLGDGSFADAATALGASTLSDPNAMTYGAAIYDFDNDGWLDILAAAGPLHGDMPISSQPSEQPDVLLQGGPDGFTDISVDQGIDDSAAGRGVAVGMLDDDGMLEAVVTHLDAPTRLYRSDCTENRALVIDLVGHAPNTFGIGARIEVQIGDRMLSRVVSTHSGWGSSIHPRAHFGLGDEPIDSVVLTWPSGVVQELDIGPWADGRVTVSEP